MLPPPALPGPSSPRPGRTPFVGRVVELDALRTRLTAARQGDGGVVLVAGDPGIGKTRLVGELAEHARSEGWTVLTGRAYQAEGLPPYLPFIEALREYVRAAPPEVLRSQLGEGAADVSLLVRDLHSVLPELAAPTVTFPDTDRYRLFESITDFLLAIAAQGLSPRDSGLTPGLLLVLDDLHWADLSSLQLLLHLARRLTGRPVLVAGTYREMEVERGHPLADVLAGLVREGVTEQIALRGLGEEDVARFIELAAGVMPPAALVATVSRESEGNPLFVVELLRLLRAEGRLSEGERGTAWRLTIPQSIQQVIGRRLDRLSTACNAVLTLAAVIGREFSLLALEQAGDVTGDALLEALEEAEAARFVAALPEAPGRCIFTHPLIRETLYGQTLTSRRVRLHRLVAEALERLYAPNTEPHSAELAHHFFQGAPGGDVRKAIAYARHAGDRALALLAYEDATRLYQTALQALTLKAPEEPLRCELMLALAEAQTRAGETATGRETFRHAAELAETLGLAPLQARAALGFGGYRGQPGLVDTPFVELAERALAALDERPSGLRARLMARLAMEIYHAGDAQERCELLSLEAVETARRADDRAALAAALVGRHYATHTPDNLEERLAITAELIQLAETAGDREVALQGHYLRTIDMLEAADLASVMREIEAHERLASEVRHPVYLWRTDLLRGMVAILEGRLGEGAQLAQRAYAVSLRAQIPNSFAAYGMQMVAICLHTGGLEAFEAAYHQLIDRFPRFVAYRAGLALVLTFLGRREEAREQFERVAEADFTDLPRDDNFFTSVACLSEVSFELEDARRAAALYAIAVPYADRAVAVNAAVACLGSLHLYLGILASTLRRWDTAERHYQDALAANARLRSEPYIVLTHIRYAAMLLRRDGPGDRARARDLLTAALAGAEALGMSMVAGWARALLMGEQGPSARRQDETRDSAGAQDSGLRIVLPDGLTEREVEVLCLVAEGRTNREIAGRLVLSTRTVDHHIAKIYRKINARRRADAAAYAQRLGLAPPQE